MTTIKNINGGNETVKSSARFAGCETLEAMKSRLHKNETIGCYAYNFGQYTQVEVRKINACGRKVIVATAEVA